MTSVHEPAAAAAAGAGAPDTAARLGRLMDGYLTTQLLHVATRLGVPDVLAGGPLTGAELADAVGAHPGRLTRVLRGLALEDVVEELGDGRFALTATGELLRRDAAVSMGDLALIRGALYHRAAGELLAGILDPVATPFERAYGEPFFALLGRDPALGPAFHAAMANRSEHEAGEVVAALSGADAWRTVVDVGGGSGVLLGALLAAHPQLHGTLLDVPPALPAARERLARLGLAGRAATVPGDFFASVPAGADGYVLSRILHDWEDEAAGRILTAVRDAMRPDSRLVVVEALLPERATDLPPAIRMDLTMLILLGARERTEGEFGALLERAGLRLERVAGTGSPLGVSVLEAVPDGR